MLAGMAEIKVEDWQDFVDSITKRIGPHTADALNRFRARLRKIIRGLAARTTSNMLLRVCARPIVGATYIQMLKSLGITPEPPSPAFIEQLIDDALRSEPHSGTSK